MIITALENQTILDILIQHTGMIENSFAIAQANGVSISDILTPGRDIIISDQLNIDEDVYSYFDAKGIQPATAITENLIEVKPLAGINYWEIEETFEVQ
ncbi:hypothetical protein V2E39_16830 [Chryseobacterium arthrosphaerae]|uniref:LysM domain-containing protein n=1 Tax=Chryseobacterium arthrosphaerae TaxID=651561 RepID=A0ABU7R2M1_9FLAO